MIIVTGVVMVIVKKAVMMVVVMVVIMVKMKVNSIVETTQRLIQISLVTGIHISCWKERYKSNRNK